MTYLFAAYTIIWLIIFAYTLLMGRREKQLAEDLRMLQKAMENKGI